MKTCLLANTNHKSLIKETCMLKKDKSQATKKKESEGNVKTPRKFPSYAEVEAEKMKSN